MSDQRRSKLAAERELEVLTIGLRLLRRRGWLIAILLAFLLALLECSGLGSLGLSPLIMIVWGGHVQTIDAAIFG